MAPEKPLEVDDHVRGLIVARGLTEAHIRYCKENNTDGYATEDSVVWACSLPSGRKMKVKAKEGEYTFLVIYAFLY